MKKVLFISGILTILFLALSLTGRASADETVKAAMNQGNQHFASADYDKALAAYETGLAANAESKPLNYNAAQAAYFTGEYEKAIDYFDKSEDTVEKFLTEGNICYRGGEAVQDINQRIQLYTQAVQYYKEGIIKYPKEVALKYNYEMVKEKLDELLENMEQENSEQGEEGEEGEEEESSNQENQEQESQSGEGSQGNEEQESEDANNSQNGQEQESEASENSQDGEEQASEQEENGDNQSQSQDGDGEQESGASQDGGENAADQEAVERILKMLENQEEQSLKNNQEVVGGNEGKNGW